MCQSCEKQRTLGFDGQPDFVAPARYVQSDDERECAACEDKFHPADMIEGPDGNDYCEDCHNDTFICCEDCGETVAIEDCNEVSHYNYRTRRTITESVCTDCSVSCESCGCGVRNNESHSAGHDGPYCEDCFDGRYTYCDGCYDYYPSDEVHVSDYGCYCNGCRPTDDCCGSKGFRRSSESCEFVGSLRTFGVELETSDCDGAHNLDGRTVFESKEDGSISGLEFVSDVLSGDDGIAEVREFTRLANREGFSTDSSCGYHLHIGVRDLTIEQLKAVCKAYKATEDFWNSIVDSSRDDGTWCKRLDDHSWQADELDDCEDLDDFERWAGYKCRYKWFNPAAYSRHSTLEIRLHHETLGGNAVCNWIAAHIRFVEYVANYGHSEFVGKSNQAIMRIMRDKIWNDGLADYYSVLYREEYAGCGVLVAA